MSKGVDADRVSIAAWLDILVVTIIEHMDPDKVTMFVSKLEMPPPEVTTEQQPEELTMTSDEFRSLMAN